MRLFASFFLLRPVKIVSNFKVKIQMYQYICREFVIVIQSISRVINGVFGVELNLQYDVKKKKKRRCITRNAVSFGNKV